MKCVFVLAILLASASCGGTRARYAGHPVPSCAAQRPYVDTIPRSR